MEDKLIDVGIIYIIEHNTLPNLKYIGQTKNSLTKRIYGHRTILKKFDNMWYRLGFFVNYYDGIKNFNFKELKRFNNISKEDLYNEEIKLINELGTLNTNNCNEDITIKITNEMRNELIKKLIDKNTNIVDLYTLIDTFNYNYKREKLDFELNETNKELLDNILNKYLFDNLLNMNVLTDEIEEDINSTYTLTKTFIENECIIEDYIEYINYFNKHFEITNNKKDEYIYDDLLNEFETYTEDNELFDFYLMYDLDKIFQIYFNLLNQIYKNVNINYKSCIIYGIKKRNELSFRYTNHLIQLINYSINNVDNDNFEQIEIQNIIKNMIDNYGGYSSRTNITNNKLKISNLKELLIPLLKQYLNTNNRNIYSYKKYNDKHIILLYKYDYNIINNIEDVRLLNILNYTIDNIDENRFKIIDNKYIVKI
jgi:hypothetical protein